MILSSRSARCATTRAKRWDSSRNRLIHGYDQVDLDIVWAKVTSDLPALVAHLDQKLAGG